MSIVNVNVESDYIVACARIRDVTVTTLVRRLVQAIEEDQLVLAVLDDAEDYQRRERYQHSFRLKNGLPPPQAVPASCVVACTSRR